MQRDTLVELHFGHHLRRADAAVGNPHGEFARKRITHASVARLLVMRDRVGLPDELLQPPPRVTLTPHVPRVVFEHITCRALHQFPLLKNFDPLVPRQHAQLLRLHTNRLSHQICFEFPVHLCLSIRSLRLPILQLRVALHSLFHLRRLLHVALRSAHDLPFAVAPLVEVSLAFELHLQPADGKVESIISREQSRNERIGLSASTALQGLLLNGVHVVSCGQRGLSEFAKRGVATSLWHAVQGVFKIHVVADHVSGLNI